MKRVTPALAAHLDQDTTTLCRLLRVNRKDGTVVRPTDFDQSFHYPDDGPTSWGPLATTASPWWTLTNDVMVQTSYAGLVGSSSLDYVAASGAWGPSQIFGGFGSGPNLAFQGSQSFGDDYTFEAIMSIRMDVSGAGGKVEVGMADGTIWNSHYIGFSVNKSSGASWGNWQLRMGNGSTFSTVDSGVVVTDAARTKLKIIVSPGRTRVSWYINGAFVGEKLTGIPAGNLAIDTQFQSASFSGSLFYRVESLMVTATVSRGGGTYLPQDGLEISAIEHKDDGSANNVQATGFLASGGITEHDVRARLYDGATFQLRTANWADLSQGDMKLLSGTVGDISMLNGKFEMQLRGLTQKLSTQIGSKYGQICRAELFGGGAEGIDPANHWKCRLNRADWVQTGTLLDSPDSITLIPSPSSALLMIGSSTPSTAAPAGWFDSGVIKFTSGVLSGYSFEVATWDGTTLYLFGGAPMPDEPTAGDTFEIEPGCAKLISVCKAKFNNVINFAGESNIPGLNVLSVVGRPQVQTR